MNKILLSLLILVLVAHFFYKQSPKFTQVEQNLSLKESNLTTLDKNESSQKPENAQFDIEINENLSAETIIDGGEPLQESILPSLKKLIEQLSLDKKPPTSSKSNLLPYINEQAGFASEQSAVQGYFDTSKLPKVPNLSLNDLNFSGANLATRLFEPNARGKKLWQNAINWELWKKNERANKGIYTLLGGFYLYQSERGEGYLSDEIGISLQKSRKNAYFISIITPQSYDNRRILGYKSLDDYFIFKVGEKKFIIAYLFNRDFTLWWDCELNGNELKAYPIASSSGFSIYTSDTNAYEMRLSENETH